MLCSLHRPDFCHCFLWETAFAFHWVPGWCAHGLGLLCCVTYSLYFNSTHSRSLLHRVIPVQTYYMVNCKIFKWLKVLMFCFLWSLFGQAVALPLQWWRTSCCVFLVDGVMKRSRYSQQANSINTQAVTSPCHTPRCLFMTLFMLVCEVTNLTDFISACPDIA